MCVIFLLSCDFSVFTDPTLDTFTMSFEHVASLVISD